MRKELWTFRAEWNRRRSTARFAKYFSRVDRDPEEVIDYCGELFDAYGGKYWADDVDGAWEDSESD